MESATNPDRHRNRPIMARPDPQLREHAQRLLAEHGWTTSDFMIAALMLLTRNPEAMLRRLADFRPPARRGRPPRDRR